MYILECADGTYYTGYTNDLTRRLAEHRSGKGAKYTRDRRPLRLRWKKPYRIFKLAFLEEKRIKSLTRRQKETLVKKRTIRRIRLKRQPAGRGARGSASPLCCKGIDLRNSIVHAGFVCYNQQSFLLSALPQGEHLQDHLTFHP